LTEIKSARQRLPRSGLIFILITIWIDVLSWSVTAPVFPTLVVQLSGGDAVEGAAVSGIFLALFALVQLFASPVLGALTDHHSHLMVARDLMPVRQTDWSKKRSEYHGGGCNFAWL
jgi:MFS family permease